MKMMVFFTNSVQQRRKWARKPNQALHLTTRASAICQYSSTSWNTEAGGGGTEFTAATAVTADITVYAQWTINTYTVTFDSQGGSAVNSQTVEHGGLATEPTDPTKTGYTFGGWYKESGCTNAWNFDTDTVTSDVTLYAKWTANNYNITFDKNDDAATETMADQTIASGSSAALTACVFTKTGWTFAGWAETSGGVVVYANQASYTMGTANVTLYAKWTPPETYAIGDRGPAGGWIFYDQGSYANFWRYLGCSQRSEHRRPMGLL